MNALHALLLGMLVACSTADGAPRVSPHGSADGCLSCHLDSTGKTFVGGTDTTACRSCHDEESHQVGIAPQRSEVPESFPLPDGKLACQTCHDEPACDGKQRVDANPRFFRGGPYAHLGDLCANCHKETAIDRFDPHTAMRDTDPVHRADACLFCHDSIPEEGKTDDLRMPGVETCRGCHFETSHAGSGEHMVKLDAAMAEGARKANLPLAEGNAATCATCHDPHPAGTTKASAERAGWGEVRVVPASWERAVLAPAQKDRLGDRAAPVLKGMDLLRLPIDDGSLCKACHGAGPAHRGSK